MLTGFLKDTILKSCVQTWLSEILSIAKVMMEWNYFYIPFGKVSSEFSS